MSSDPGEQPMHSFAEILAWLAQEQQTQTLTVEKIPFTQLDQWQLGGDPLRLAHRSGRFFTIEGLHVQTDAGPVPCWDQPIIHQPEIGILGIVTSVFGNVRHYLMQAKVEPGNINGVQLSPTVQATFSNYSRVHRGASTPFLEYFIEPGPGRIVIDLLQGEQGSRFLRKRNRNMVVALPADFASQLPTGSRFRWMTLRQIRRLLKQDNVVNMDARSVLACIPTGYGQGWLESAAPHDFSFFDDSVAVRSHPLQPGASCHTTDEIIHWLTDLRSRHHLLLEPRPLDRLEEWEIDDCAIRHQSGNIFAVIAVSVATHTREIPRWTQPLLHHPGYGLNGFLLQRIDGVVHLLMRACIYPGNREIFELGSTVSRSNADLYLGRPHAPRYLDVFHTPPPEQIRYAAVQSEEGGRFYHYQNRYMILEVPPATQLEPSPIHRWMSLAQVQDFVRHGYVNIEGRNLLACLDLSLAQASEPPPERFPLPGSRQPGNAQTWNHP